MGKNIQLVVNYQNTVPLAVEPRFRADGSLKPGPKTADVYRAYYIDRSRYTGETIKKLTAEYGIRGKKRAG